jgi:hypothetical protein
MGTFATLSDMATEIKAAAVAEVAAPGSGAALVTFTDATAVSAAAVTAAAEIVEVVAAAAAEGGGGSAPSAEATAAAAAAAEAAAIEVAAAAEAAANAAAAAADAAANAAFALAEANKAKFQITSDTGASWDGASATAQQLDATVTGTTYAIISDVQVEADDFTAAFDDAAVNTTVPKLGQLAISNIRVPTQGTGQNDQEVTITIQESGTTGKLVVGFTVDWSFSGDDFTFTSDDSYLDVTYTERDNSSTTVNIANLEANALTITNDGTYGGNSTLNVNALNLITKLESTGIYTFDNLETRFATADTTLDVTVDISNLDVIYSTGDIETITATIHIV